MEPAADTFRTVFDADFYRCVTGAIAAAESQEAALDAVAVAMVQVAIGGDAAEPQPWRTVEQLLARACRRGQRDETSLAIPRPAPDVRPRTAYAVRWASWPTRWRTSTSTPATPSPPRTGPGSRATTCARRSRPPSSVWFGGRRSVGAGGAAPLGWARGRPDPPGAPAIEGATHLHSGKVRDLYRIDGGEHDGQLLMVASDRISAFDFVLDTTIPDKGEILTRMSLWWFDQLADLVPQPRRVDRRARRGRGRAVVCERARHVPRRVRGPRLPHRLRPARLPRHRRGLRHRAARRARGRQPAARADLHPGHQGRPRRPRRERSYDAVVEPSAPTPPPSCAS